MATNDKNGDRIVVGDYVKYAPEEGKGKFLYRFESQMSSHINIRALMSGDLLSVNELKVEKTDPPSKEVLEKVKLEAMARQAKAAGDAEENKVEENKDG